MPYLKSIPSAMSMRLHWLSSPPLRYKAPSSVASPPCGRCHFSCLYIASFPLWFPLPWCAGWTLSPVLPRPRVARAPHAEETESSSPPPPLPLVGECPISHLLGDHPGIGDDNISFLPGVHHA